jgi:hypothetical protein
MCTSKTPSAIAQWKRTLLGTDVNILNTAKTSLESELIKQRTDLAESTKRETLNDCSHTEPPRGGYASQRAKLAHSA